MLQVLTRREERPSCLLDKHWSKNWLRQRETDGGVDEVRRGLGTAAWRNRPARRREAGAGVEEVQRGLETAAWRRRPAQRRSRREADGGVEERRRRRGKMAGGYSVYEGTGRFGRGIYTSPTRPNLNVAAVRRVPGSRGLPYTGPKKTNFLVKLKIVWASPVGVSCLSSSDKSLGRNPDFFSFNLMSGGGARKVAAGAVRQTTSCC